MVKIALDMMGGDLGIDASLGGLNHFLSAYNRDDVSFTLFGNETKILNEISKYKNIKDHLFSIYNTGTKIISADEKPMTAVRSGRGSSMFEAIEHVHTDKSDAVISSGNTGAYMALSKLLLKMMDNLDRPPLVSLMPNEKGRSVMLDLGANTECSALKLVQFAMMGKAVAQVLLNIENPSIGLLNIGTEKSKGTESLIEAYNMLENMSDLNFKGFIEGTDITRGTSDVIVTDGFCGNIALKTMEGTIKFFGSLIKKGFSESIISKIGYIFCSKVFKSVKNHLDPRLYNGAPLLGLNKIVIKSHGSSDYIGFSNAIKVAVELVQADFISNIKKALSNISQNSEK